MAVLSTAGVPGRADEGHEVVFETGIAHDSNPFLSPREEYFDQNAGRVVEPVRVSGFYTPVFLEGLLTTRHSFVSYGVDGRLHPSSETRNAESFELRVAPGLLLDFGGEQRDRSLRLGPYWAQNKEVFFDRDTGLAGGSADVDAADRYTYRSLGASLDLAVEVNRAFEFSLEGTGEQRDYEEVVGLSSLDHDVIEATAGVGIRMGRRASIELGYGHEVRSYNERQARDLDGESSDLNPPLEYRYQVKKARLRFRNAGEWRLSLTWERTDRTDEFEGYNGYVQDRYKLRTSFGGRRWKLTLFGALRDRSFENAFIFDEPLSLEDGSPNPRKAYEASEYGIEFRIELGHFHLLIGGDRKTQETTDPRFSYLRSRTMIGGRWEF